LNESGILSSSVIEVAIWFIRTRDQRPCDECRGIQSPNFNFLLSEEGWFTCKHVGYKATIRQMWEVFKVEKCVLGSEDKKNQPNIWKKIVSCGWVLKTIYLDRVQKDHLEQVQDLPSRWRFKKIISKDVMIFHMDQHSRRPSSTQIRTPHMDQAQRIHQHNHPLTRYCSLMLIILD